jgi:Fungal specific transcription factor domain
MDATMASTDVNGLSDESTVEDSHAQEDGQGSKRFTRLRACERCKRMKVRCEVNDNSQRCKRCDQADQDCVPTESRPKRRRTDRRVTELEQKVASLTASLVAHGYPDGITAEAPIAETAERGADQLITQHSTDDSESAFPRINTFQSQGRQEILFRDGIGTWIGIPGNTAFVDAIDRQILDAATAYQIFNRYHFQMSQYFPFVVFSYTTKPEDIRRTKPILFHTILAVAAASVRPDLRQLLIDEITRMMADRVMYRGEKSVELIQALLVLVVHYQRPRQLKELNFLQIVHSAAIMALDLGLGKRSTPKGTDGTAPESTMNEAEARRVWLGCYYLCAK